MKTILSTDLTPNAFKANKNRKSKNTSSSTDGIPNIANTEDKNTSANKKKKHQAVAITCVAPSILPQQLPLQQTVMDV